MPWLTGRLARRLIASASWIASWIASFTISQACLLGRADPDLNQ